MDDGGGLDLYRWLLAHRPRLAERVVFLSGGDITELQAAPPGRPMFRKGQDAQALTTVMHEIVRQGRLQAADATVDSPVDGEHTLPGRLPWE